MLGVVDLDMDVDASAVDLVEHHLDGLEQHLVHIEVLLGERERVVLQFGQVQQVIDHVAHHLLRQQLVLHYFLHLPQTALGLPNHLLRYLVDHCSPPQLQMLLVGLLTHHLLQCA